MAPHSRTLAWKIPWTEEPGRLQSMGSLESDTTERLHFHFSLSCIGEGNGNPLQCLPGESQGCGSPVGCHLWGRTELDTNELTQHQQLYPTRCSAWYVFTVIHLSSLFLSPCFMPGWSASESVVFLPLAIKSLTICYGGLSLVEEWYNIRNHSSQYEQKLTLLNCRIYNFSPLPQAESKHCATQRYGIRLEHAL